MATIKSYTDIEQSKKLAEILPLESADMYYEPSAGFCTEPSEVRFGDIKYAHPRSIRCWSLAALLGVLPIKLQIVLAINDFQGDRKEKYVIGSVEHDNYDCYADNPVDACVAMIEKLHELKML